MKTDIDYKIKDLFEGSNRNYVIRKYAWFKENTFLTFFSSFYVKIVVLVVVFVAITLLASAENYLYDAAFFIIETFIDSFN